MISDIQTELKKATNWSIALGVLMIIAGISAISLPLSTGLAVTFWLGWIFNFVGTTELIYAWQTRDEDRFSFILKLAIALLYLAGGIFLLVNPLKGVMTLTLVLATFLMFEGIFELVLAFKLRSLSPNWGWVLANSIVTLILAGMILAKWPSSSAWVIGLLFGINIISSGISRIMLSLAARSVLKNASFSSYYYICNYNSILVRIYLH